MNVGILYSRVRIEEKLLFDELRQRGVEFGRIDDREVLFELGKEQFAYDVVLERSINPPEEEQCPSGRAWESSAAA